MTVDALIPQTCESERILGLVTIHAAEIPVRAYQGKAVLLMQFRDVVNKPGVRCVAARAIVAHGHGMHIRVACDAIRCDRCIELNGGVA